MRDVRFTMLLLVLLLVVALSGCRVGSRELVGHYIYRHGAGTIDLALSPNGLYSETIKFHAGRVVVRHGAWLAPDNTYGFVVLEKFWIPMEFLPDALRRADDSAREEKQPKFSEPLNWSITPTREMFVFGRLMLQIYEEPDYALVKVD